MLKIFNVNEYLVKANWQVTSLLGELVANERSAFKPPAVLGSQA